MLAGVRWTRASRRSLADELRERQRSASYPKKRGNMAGRLDAPNSILPRNPAIPNASPHQATTHSAKSGSAKSRRRKSRRSRATSRRLSRRSLVGRDCRGSRRYVHGGENQIQGMRGGMRGATRSAPRPEPLSSRFARQRKVHLHIPTREAKLVPALKHARAEVEVVPGLLGERDDEVAVRGGYRVWVVPFEIFRAPLRVANRVRRVSLGAAEEAAQ